VGEELPMASLARLAGRSLWVDDTRFEISIMSKGKNRDILEEQKS
jgi:hypothetical protein